MKWFGNSIVLSTSDSCEYGSIVSVFSEEHGKWRGFCNSKKNKKVNAGDICYTTWSNRLEDGLGNFTFEQIFSVFQYNFSQKLYLLAIQSTCQLLNMFLADRDKHVELYTDTQNLLRNISLKEYAIWEIKLLKYVGYGLDFSKCAITGQKDGLYYISPKTGRCIIKEVGEQYKSRLFIIPNFWKNSTVSENVDTAHIDEIKESLKITGFFINKEIDKKMSYRNMLLSQLEKL